ncbi:hypothetical protein [Shimia abyssi]|uniref:Uncharacterized protein n=1 Tax=Shimia abyssi TaxID=1662395 RepID=A0A2P8EVU5_9RHOB|nr:hypothetical protein [Shimia abyssi]PSL13591.1 hypothetical protein CLV88_13211 [Shimia abyssi]
MKNIAKTCFVTAVLFALVGMGWGIQMSATHDHTLSPAHGHLNLLGFVAMAVYGSYYAVSPEAGQSRLAQFHYALAVLSVIVLVPGIVLAITGSGETLAKVGSVFSVLSMVLFGLVVLKFRLGGQESTAT